MYFKAHNFLLLKNPDPCSNCALTRIIEIVNCCISKLSILMITEVDSESDASSFNIWIYFL